MASLGSCTLCTMFITGHNVQGCRHRPTRTPQPRCGSGFHARGTLAGSRDSLGECGADIASLGICVRARMGCGCCRSCDYSIIITSIQVCQIFPYPYFPASRILCTKFVKHHHRLADGAFPSVGFASGSGQPTPCTIWLLNVPSSPEFFSGKTRCRHSKRCPIPSSTMSSL